MYVVCVYIRMSCVGKASYTAVRIEYAVCMYVLRKAGSEYNGGVRRGGANEGEGLGLGLWPGLRFKA